MRFLIHDASVLIDLINGKLLGRALDLLYTMATTDFVQYEIRDPDQRAIVEGCISSGALQLLSSDGDQIIKIRTIQQEFTGLSIADCSVIFDADLFKGVIISGDKKLRKAAKAKKLEVHGTLWVIDQLVQNNLIGSAEAKESLELIMQKNPRLPVEQCNALLERWGKYNTKALFHWNHKEMLDD